MQTVKDAPRSGYTITAVNIVGQRLEPADLNKVESSEYGQVQFGWDWRLADEDSFEVLVSVTVEPERDRQFRASVDLVGRFRRADPSTSVGLQDFVKLQAVAILLPYVRQAIATLTLSTASGVYHLPSINVVSLMKDFDANQATGAQQLAEADRPVATDLIESAEVGEKIEPPSLRNRKTSRKRKGDVRH